MTEKYTGNCATCDNYSECQRSGRTKGPFLATCPDIKTSKSAQAELDRLNHKAEFDVWLDEHYPNEKV